MKYVQATKPEKHNGGSFFEHEIHIDCADWRHNMKQRVIDFMAESSDQKHVDYRISTTSRRDEWPKDEPQNPWAGKWRLTPVTIVRFQDKNKALMFKLAFQP